MKTISECSDAQGEVIRVGDLISTHYWGRRRITQCVLWTTGEICVYFSTKRGEVWDQAKWVRKWSKNTHSDAVASGTFALSPGEVRRLLRERDLTFDEIVAAAGFPDEPAARDAVKRSVDALNEACEISRSGDLWHAL